MNENRLMILYSPYEELINSYAEEFKNAGSLLVDVTSFYRKHGLRDAQKKLLKIVKENKINILFYAGKSQEFLFPVSFFRELQKKIFTSMMLTDADHFFDSRDIYYAQAMDLVICLDQPSRYRFKNYGIDAISFYSLFNAQKYVKTNDTRRDIPVSFVGLVGLKMFRKTYIDYIVSNGIAVDVYGNNSPNGFISKEKMVEVFNRTKINLNFTGMSTMTTIGKELNIQKLRRQMKGRIAEIALCGGFVLSDYASGMEEVFEIDKEIVVFSSKEEMLEKIKYYIDHDDEREEIAARGYERAQKDYDTHEAIPRLVRILYEAKQRKQHKVIRELVSDRHFEKNYATYRFEMCVVFLRNRMFKLAWLELLEIMKIRRLNFSRVLRIIMSNLFPRMREMYRVRIGKKY
ncbi:MAG: glycosyltransferase [Deltaproteobacteria bacterium]|nr:glycosyltransferase [Deltaproteobacteria bacterium]